MMGQVGDQPRWVQALYEIGLGEVSDQQIIDMFDALESAIYTDLDELDSALATIDTRRLAKGRQLKR